MKHTISISELKDKESGVVETVSILASDCNMRTNKRLLAVTRWNDNMQELRAYYQVLDHGVLVCSVTDIYKAIADYNEIA